MAKNPLKPEIINFLKSVAIEDTFSHENKLRHPGGIYNIASLHLISSLNKFIDVFQSTDDIEIISERFRLLIYDLFKFNDSCYEILACFCQGTKPLKTRDFIDQWIDRNNYSCANDFKLLIQNDIKILKRMYNKFKHTSNFAEYISIDAATFKAYGYFLLAFDKNNAQVTSDDNIYPISFYREIRNIYYLIHKMSESLLEVLKSHIPKHNGNIEFKSIETDSNLGWEELHKKIATLPKKYLKNEIGKEIIYPKIDGDRVLFDKIILNEDDWSNEYPKSFKIQITTKGDGYTKTFSVPHMGLPPKDI